VAQSGGVTCGEDQPTRQLGLRLRRVLILFEDNRAGISRLCAIAEDPAGAAVLLEPVRTRAPNRQRIRIVRKLQDISNGNDRPIYTERTADFYFRDSVAP